eukprot:4471479-Pyramimonas_sp.AAC.1
MPTVVSTLLERRLRWWQHVLRPAFRVAADGDVDDYDPTRAVRAAVFGRFSFEPEGRRECTSLLHLLAQDIDKLWQVLGGAHRAQAIQDYHLPATGPRVDAEGFKWLLKVPVHLIRKVRSFSTEFELQQARGDAPDVELLPCPECGRLCK